MVLLVAAVELQQLYRIFRKADFFIGEFRQQRFTQMLAVELALFSFGEGLVGVVCRCHRASDHPDKKESFEGSETASNKVACGCVDAVTATFLLEIGTEELPADFACQSLDQLKVVVEKDLNDQRLHHGDVHVTGTPRRLVVRVDALVDRQPDLTEERKGPPASQAFKDGVPTQAAIGFAKRCGVPPESLEIRDSPKGPCVFATVHTAGQASTDLLQTMIPAWINALQGRRFMRWGIGNQRFSRPIRWLVALLGSSLVPVEMNDADPPLCSGRTSRGHRLHSDAPLHISDADEFLPTLEAAGVIVDRHHRSMLIREAIDRACAELGARPNCPPKLFKELVDLVESPRILQGRIADRYLGLPPEVISTVMQAHQRYVPLELTDGDPDPLQLDASAVLRPEFLVVGNGLEAASDLITRGNERVLGARLADAEFFLGVDRRQPSESRRDALSRVTFAEGLGSLRDRCDRIERITQLLLEQLKPDAAQTKAALRAAHLCKHDLVSQMVGEFPELQGLMGGKYLLEEGESRETALAVVEHYLPRGAGDRLPGSDAGAVVALAERLELLLSIYAKGERPTGSSDPYALRRAGNGLMLILWDRGWRMDLQSLLSRTVDEWADRFPAFAVDRNQLLEDLTLLLRQRIVSQLEEDGHAPDLVQAVAGETIAPERLLVDPIDVQDRIQLLSSLRRNDRLEALQAVVQRAARLAAKADLDEYTLSVDSVVDPQRFESSSEQGMFDVLNKLQPLASERRYAELSESLVQATPVLESFFDGENSVMVMADDPELRRNRLNLLAVLRNQATVLGQFDLIQA